MGSGYEIMTFYQWTFLQVMYLLQFKNLDSQTAVGYGQINGIATAGTSNTRGMIYGSNSQNEQIKLFGLENLWGGIDHYVDGCCINASYNILTTTNEFNNDASSYKNIGTMPYQKEISGYINQVFGTSEAGFIPVYCNGSYSTYYRDNGGVNISNKSTTVVVGGRGHGAYGLGIFAMAVTISNYTGSYDGARLSYY